jgi:hypothetical protein
VREVLQLRTILSLPNRLTRAADGKSDHERANLWISKNGWC